MFQIEAQGSAAAMAAQISGLTSGTPTDPNDPVTLALAQTLAQSLLTNLQNTALTGGLVSTGFHIIISGSGGAHNARVNVKIEAARLDVNNKIMVPPVKGF